MKKTLSSWSILLAMLLFCPNFTFAESEPNDDIYSANTLNVNGSETGTLSSTENYDWYKITIPYDGKLVISTTSDATVCPIIYMYDQDSTTSLGNTYSYACTSYYKELVLNNILPGTYFIRVDRHSGSGNYTLSANLTGAILPNDPENNDSLHLAVEILPNDSVTGHHGYKGYGYTDWYDWYKISVPVDGKLTITTHGESSGCIVAYLIDQDSISYLKNTYLYACTDSVKTMTYDNILPGTYFLRLQTVSGYGSYALVSSFIEATYPADSENNDSLHLAVEILPNDSVTGHHGYKGYGYTDLYDWYKISVPVDGKLTITTHGESSGCIVAYLIDQDSISYLKNTYLYACTDLVKTMTYDNILPGTYFLRLKTYSGYGSYALVSSFIEATYPADSEANDSVQGALPLSMNDSVVGHMGYFGYGYTDIIDYYYFDVPQEGKLTLSTTSDSTGCLTSYLFNQDMVAYLRNTYWFSCDTLYKDMTHENILPGRYYVTVQKYTGYSPYILKCDFEPAPFHIDTIYDDSLKYAVMLPENDTVSGLQGYTGNNLTDTEDWWKIVLEEDGKVEFKTWTDSTLCLTAYLFDSSNVYYGNTYNYSCSQYIKTAKSSLLSKGVYYLRTKAYSGYGNYKLTYNLLPVPKPSFTVYQNLFDVTATNQSIDASSYEWDFGDGTKETSVSPKHTYALPGVYTICLTATNETGSAEFCHEVEFKGIQSLSPQSGGNTGDATINVYGGGFTEKSKFWLTDGTNTIYPDTSILIERGTLRGTFDIREKSADFYDLVVDYGDGSANETLMEAFEVVQGIKADPWVNIVGRDKILFNRWQTYTINYGNKGNVDATGVPLWIVVPNTPGTEVRFVDFKVDIPITDDPLWQLVKDSIPIYVDVDHFDGEAKPVRIYPLFIPVIPSGQNYSIKIQVKTNSDFELIAWTSPPLFQSPVDPDVADCIRWAQVKAVANGLVNVINEQLPGVGCVNNVLQTVYGMTYGDAQPISSHIWNIGRATLSCASDFFGPLKAYQISIKVIELGLDIYDNYSAENECKKPKPDPKDPNKQKKPPFNDQPRSKRKARAVSSFDPNEIVGPSGYSENNYVREGTDFNYSIYYENKATATAPAGEVIIIDTLDQNIFDLSSFELTYFNFGDSTYQIPQGLKEYSLDVDMRPEKPIILRISASLDTITGIAKWQYISLDTLTMDLTEDPDAGFLPPNITAPEGEGHVGFKLQLRDDFVYSNAIMNKAIIYFDANPPIYTNTYINYIDQDAPTSMIDAISSPTNDTSFTVSWSGNDNNSGIASYSVLVSENDGEFSTWIGLTNSTSSSFTGKPGHTYKFKCMAVDNVGNAEEIHSSTDASVTINEINAIYLPSISSVQIYPNPTHDMLNISFESNSADPVEVVIYDQSSREVKKAIFNETNIGNQTYEINLEGIIPGYYIVEITNNGQSIKNRLIIMP